ncbi:MAG: sugar ABC transporter permease [Armatimonadota bacterium]|nr:MAG: sugar ABC transporter permease [Armatimonadota bacterium]
MTSQARSAFMAGFLLPATVLYALFVVMPVVQAFAFSLYRWRGISANRTFVGLENFRQLFADPIVWLAIRHNLLLFVGTSVVILAMAIALAHAIGHETGTARFLRAVYLFPQVISLVVVAILWMFILNPSFGILNATLKAAGLERWAIAWLGERSTALASIGVAHVWHALGFYIMLFAAALRTIPPDVMEAATLDGAMGLTRLRYVTLPMLWAVLRIALVYMAIGTMNIFSLVFLMTQGGPDRATEVMLTYLYEQAFKHSEFGYATALAVVNFVLVMALSGAILALFRHNPQEGRA